MTMTAIDTHLLLPSIMPVVLTVPNLHAWGAPKFTWVVDIVGVNFKVAIAAINIAPVNIVGT